MAYDFAPRRASLYQLDADHGVRVILRGVTISNGLVWSLEGSTVYYIDTPTQRVDAFDFDAAEGTLSNRRTVVEIPKSDGEPDGMTIDTEGVYGWRCGAEQRFTLLATGPPRRGGRRAGFAGLVLRLRRAEPRRALHHHIT
jgi:sugar lactone lactonase YvrE